jgi:hypothetical protein
VITAPPFGPATLTVSLCLSVSGLSLVFHVLLDQTTLLLQKKSIFWLAVWFTLNISIWCIKIIPAVITLLSSQSLYKGPRGIGDCFQRSGLVFIVHFYPLPHCWKSNFHNQVPFHSVPIFHADLSGNCGE